MKSFFLTRNAINARDSIAEDKPQYIFPPMEGYCPDGILSTAPTTLTFLESLSRNLTDKIPASVDDEGISSSNAVPSDFRNLLTVSGFATDMYIPMTDNLKTRADLKLYDKFASPRDKEIFDSLMQLCYGSWIHANVHIARDSSTCFPYFVRGVDSKNALFEYTCRHWPQISKLISQGDFKTLYNRHNAVINYFMGVRVQPDKVDVDQHGNYVSKDRYIWDLDYALSGGARGKIWKADKRINTKDFHIKGHFRMRKRVVFGTAGWLNYFLNAIFNGFREHYLHEYEFTWKHRTADQIQDKIARYKHFIGFDVHQYDSTFAPFMFDRWEDNLRNYVRDDVVDLIHYGLHSPFYQPNVKVGGSEKLQIGDPLNPEHFKFNYGLPSGIPPNPDLGKLMMTFALLVRLDREFHDVLEVGIDSILKGKHPLYAILNMGDDSIILLNDTQIASKIKSDINDDVDPAPYFKMEKEKSISFLGNVFYHDAKGEIRLAPNLTSMFANWFVPEVGTTHRRRRYWAIGWEERNAYYMQAPGFSDAWEILLREFHDAFGLHPDIYAKRGKELAGDPQLNLMSDLERLVLDDPSKLHYRISPNEISQELREAVLTTLDDSLVQEFIHPLIRSSIT